MLMWHVSMKRAFKYRLYPNKEQTAQLEFVLDCCRRLYNCALEHKKIAWRGYSIRIGCYDQIKELPEIKEAFSEYNRVHSQILQDVLRRLDKSFQKFFKEKTGYPRFKSRDRYRSIIYPQSGFQILDNGKLKLSKIGTIRMFYHRPIQGEIKTLSIKKDFVGDWFATFVTELPDVSKKEPETAVGIDVGIEKLAAISTGEIIKHPHFLKKSELDLKKLQRRLSKKKKGSNHGKDAKLKVAKAHRKIERQRDDFLHKVSNDLVRKADLIAFEDLRINNMVKNHHLANSIMDSSWGKLVQYTTFKAENAGKFVELVNPSETSQSCSRCGVSVKKSLSVRIHRCPNCGLTIDRDVNAALNILKRVRRGTPKPVQTPGEIRSLQKLEIVSASPIGELGSP